MPKKKNSPSAEPRAVQRAVSAFVLDAPDPEVVSLRDHSLKENIRRALSMPGAQGTVELVLDPVEKVSGGGYQVRKGGKLIVEVTW